MSLLMELIKADPRNTDNVEVVNIAGEKLLIPAPPPTVYCRAPELLEYAIVKRGRAYHGPLPVTRFVDRLVMMALAGANSRATFLHENKNILIRENDATDGQMAGTWLHEAVHYLQMQENGFAFMVADPEQAIQNEIEAFCIQQDWILENRVIEDELYDFGRAELLSRIREVYSDRAQQFAEAYAKGLAPEVE